MLLDGLASHPGASVLMIGGGGAAPERHTADLLSRFIGLAGGSQAPILILTTATGNPERQRQRTGSFLEALGAQNLCAPLIRTRAEADDPQNVEYLRQARGIYLTGGDQSKYTRILEGTACGAALQNAFENGTSVIGGTSAGAHVMGQVMIAGSYDWVMQQRGQVIIKAGLGLLSDQVVVDSHFSQRRRVPRLLAVLDRYPHLLGIGLDEDTGLIVDQQGVGEVIGAGLVYFFSKRNGRIDSWTLAEGAAFDLVQRRKILYKITE